MKVLKQTKTFKKGLGILASAAAAMSLLLPTTAFAASKAGPDVYKTILGDAVNFGITANHYTQSNDLQSNFAANVFTGTAGHGINPNLSGDEPGDFLVGQIEDGSTMHITGGASAKSVFYVSKEDAPKIDDSQNHNKAVINTNYSKDTLNQKVTDMIDHALKQGENLAGHAATCKAVIEPYSGNVTLDTTALDKTDTVYVDGDSIRSAISQNGKFKIKKYANQTLVFNFNQKAMGETTLNLSQYDMTIVGDDGSTQQLNSAPDSSVGASNNHLAPQCKRMIFNVTPSSGIKNVVLTNTAGIFLLNGADASVGGTSSGWIVTNGHFENANGEWHNIYQETTAYQPENPTKPEQPATPENPEQPSNPSTPETPKQTTVKVSKKAVGGTDELPGATLTVVDTWTSGEKAQDITLPDGDYILSENTAPSGFGKTEDIAFTVKDGKVTGHDHNTVTMRDGVSLSLVKYAYLNGHLTDQPVAGSTYGLFMPMTKTAAVPKTRAELEKALADKTWAQVNEQTTDANGAITFDDAWTVNADGKPVDTQGKVVRDGQKSAKKHLGVNRLYAVLELKAPAGSQRTANPAVIAVKADGTLEQTFDANGAATVRAENHQIVWQETTAAAAFAKVDVDGNPVDGAKLELRDHNNNVVASWQSDKNEPLHQVNGLTPGERYTLREIEAPDGYQLADDITFTLKEKDITGVDAYVQTVEKMVDEKVTTDAPKESETVKPSKPQNPSKPKAEKHQGAMKQTAKPGVVQTGDHTKTALYVVAAMVAGLALVGILCSKKKEK